MAQKRPERGHVRRFRVGTLSFKLRRVCGLIINMGCDNSKDRTKELEQIKEAIRQNEQVKRKMIDELESSTIEIQKKKENQSKASMKIANLENKLMLLHNLLAEEAGNS